MDEKKEQPNPIEADLVTPKLEADKLMKELMVNSQNALIDMMRKSGLSGDALKDLKNDLSDNETSLAMTDDVSWDEYLMSSEQQKARITQASKQALLDFQNSVKQNNASALASAQVEPMTTQAPNMEALMSTVNQNQKSENEHE